MSLEKKGTIWVDPSRFGKAPVFFDIGANDGTVSVDLLEEFGGLCVAYEPGEICKIISPRNGLKIYNKAVWVKSGLVPFCECDKQTQSSSVFMRKPRKGNAVWRDVECVTLSIVMRGRDWVDFLSMDIEGGEWDLLDSGQILNLRRVDQICIEFHTEFSGGRTVDEMVQRLSDLAWFDCKIVEQNYLTRPIIYGVKQKMPLRQDSNQWIRDVLAGQHFGRVLNLGCGSDRDQEGGQYSVDYFGSNEVVLCDSDQEVATRNPSVVIARSEDLPFESNSFDFVFANWMIYKTDVLLSLREIVRVLKPGGRVLLSYGIRDLELVRTITESAKTLFDVEANFSMYYAAGGALRRAEIVYGSVRKEAEGNFNMEFVDPVLVVVAHWDDESISLGGILNRSGRGWTVVSATHRDQAKEFRSLFSGVGSDLGFHPFTLDLRQRVRPMENGEDRHHYARTVRRIDLDRDTMQPALEKALGDLSRFKTVITHNPTGDHGSHPQHAELAHSITEIFKGTAKVWGFSLKTGTVVFPLSEGEIDQKLELIRRYKPAFLRDSIPKNEYLMRLG